MSPTIRFMTLVRRKLADDQVVKGGAMEVEVKDGVVTLRGKVETDNRRTRPKDSRTKCPASSR